MVDAISHGKVIAEGLGRSSVMVRLLIFAFVIVCVFDPADQILGAKVWLFVAAWCATVAGLWANDEDPQLPMGLLVCVLLFISIPLLSILWYYLSNGSQPYAGFALLKSYFLVSLALILVLNRIDVVPFLSAALTILALLTTAVFITLQWKPELFLPLHTLGSDTGLMTLGGRSYGTGLSFIRVNIVTSPMLAISICYYFDRAMSEPVVRFKLFYLALATISLVGLFLTGLRNAMAVALLLPIFLWPLYTRRVARNTLLGLGALVVLAIPFMGTLRVLLDPAELSNNIKLTLLGDYAGILSDPKTLLFGQGLGAYYRWSSSGLANFETTGENFYYITELTYAEMIRSFGLPCAAIMLALLLFPVAHAFFAITSTRQRAIALGFLAYLGMSATNPLLFSSTGMLFFSALLASAFQTSGDGEYSSRRALS